MTDLADFFTSSFQRSYITGAYMYVHIHKTHIILLIVSVSVPERLQVDFVQLRCARTDRESSARLSSLFLRWHLAPLWKFINFFIVQWTRKIMREFFTCNCLGLWRTLWPMRKMDLTNMVIINKYCNGFIRLRTQWNMNGSWPSHILSSKEPSVPVMNPLLSV